jgi:hypothetical protein
MGAQEKIKYAWTKKRYDYENMPPYNKKLIENEKNNQTTELGPQANTK